MDELVSGEAVVIDVPIARFPSRMCALALDLAVQAVLLAGASLAVAFSLGSLNAAWVAAIALSISVLVIVGYPAIWETLSRGRTLGKLALGLRVVGDDGSPERFRQALVRALAGVLEIWILTGAPALICALLSARGKRLGDLFAGTFVVQERLPRQSAQPPVMPPELAGWAATLELSALPDGLGAAALAYLRRYRSLDPQARDQLGHSIASAVATQTSPPPPPGTTAPDFLLAVLAERRRRAELAAVARDGDHRSL